MKTIEVAFGDYSATLDSEGCAPLLNDAGEARCDVAWFGLDVVVMNGAVEQWVGSVFDRLRIVERDEHGSEKVLVDDDVMIHDACGHNVIRGAYTMDIGPHQDFVDLYLDGGPAFEDIPLDVLSRFDKLGPDPDPNKTHTTGSGRMAWHRCRMALAMLILNRLGQEPTEAQLAECHRWTRRQWERAVNYYHRDNGYEPWVALNDVDAIVGSGYAGGGGFSTTYNATELHGRPVSGSFGANPPDEQHLAVEQLALVHVMTGSWAAGRALWHVIEKDAGFLLRNSSRQNARAFGWRARALALAWYALTPTHRGRVDHFRSGYLPTLLGNLEDQNGELAPGDWRRWPLLDDGKRCDHICLSDAAKKDLEAKGITDPDEQRAIAAESGSSWQTAVLVLGIDLVLRTGMADGEDRRRWKAQLDLAAHFLVAVCTMPGRDWKTLAFTETDFVHDDVSPRSMLVKTKPTKKGTPASVTVSALEVLLREHIPGIRDDQVRENYEIRARSAADAIVDDLNESRYWNSSDPAHWMLDSGWATGHRRGWQPDG